MGGWIHGGVGSAKLGAPHVCSQFAPSSLKPSISFSRGHEIIAKIIPHARKELRVEYVAFAEVAPSEQFS